MTEAQLAAYEAKREREARARKALHAREREALLWMETNFTSLTHYDRYVRHIEQLIDVFRAEEKRLPFFGGSSFLRELVREDPTLWADHAEAIKTIVDYTPWYVDVWREIKHLSWWRVKMLLWRHHEVLLLGFSWALFCMLLPWPLGNLWTVGMLIVSVLLLLARRAPWLSSVFWICMLNFVFQAMFYQALRLIF